MIGPWTDNLPVILPLANTGTAGSDQLWLVIAFLMLAASYLLMRPKKKKDPLGRLGHSSSLSQERNVERELQSLLVDLSKMAQQISAQLDTRAAKLEALIKEADDKIRQLTSIPQAHGENPLPSIPADPPAATDPRYNEIYSMADSGEAVRTISEKLNRPAGEIELILALRPRKPG